MKNIFIGAEGLQVAVPMMGQDGGQVGVVLELDGEGIRLLPAGRGQMGGLLAHVGEAARVMVVRDAGWRVSVQELPNATFAANDGTLLNKSPAEFQELVKEALQFNKKGISALSDSPLARSSLVERCLLEGETVSDKVRGRVMRAMLHWAIDEALRPDGQHDWQALEWRLYNVLFYPYFEDIHFLQLAEKTALVQQSLFKSRSQAITKVANFLRKELETARHLPSRQKYAIMERYHSLSCNEKAMLRMASVFGQPIPEKWLYQLAEETNLSQITSALNNLLAANLLRPHDLSQIESHPQIRPYLLPLLSPDERQTWHKRAATQYQEQEAYLKAAHHYRQIGQASGYEAAARIIVEHKQAILNRLQAQALRQLLTHFQRHELSDAPNLWYAVKIISGDLARDAEDVETAINEYAQALRAEDIDIKAKAYYRRGKAFTRQDIDEASLHYDYGIELLEPSMPERYILNNSGKNPTGFQNLSGLGTVYPYFLRRYPESPKGKTSEEQEHTCPAKSDTDPLPIKNTVDPLEEGSYSGGGGALGEDLRTRCSLLIELYIDRAWISIEARPNFEQAQKDLQRAEELIELIGNGRIMFAMLHNAWAGLEMAKGNVGQVIEHQLQAWLAADEAQDIAWMIKTARNLGEDYAELRQEYQKAVKYLHMAKDLAKQSNNREQEHLCLKSIGACYFWQEQYQEAIRYYQMAYDGCVEMGSKDWQASICYDLAEAYAELQNRANMRQYFYQGLNLSQKLKQERYMDAFKTFAEQYLNINEPQFKAICHVMQSGKISNQTYRKINDMSISQNMRKCAARHLNALCQKELLARHGKGRGVYYTLP